MLSVAGSNNTDQSAPTLNMLHTLFLSIYDGPMDFQTQNAANIRVIEELAQTHTPVSISFDE